MATLATKITQVLNRVRLSTTVDEYKNNAREYLSDAAVEVLPLVPWWFLDRTTTFRTTRTLTVTSASGTYSAGETVTDGQGTPYSATVDNWDATNSLLKVYSENSVTPTGTLTGGTSGATSTYSSRAYTRVYTPISGQVTSWWSAVNETEDGPITIVGADQYDALDWDRDEEGEVEAIFVAGLDADTGYPVLETWRIPSTTNETIRLRYRIDIGPWTSSNDATSLQTLGIPRQLEPVLLYRASQLYLEENRQWEAAQAEAANFNKAMAAAQQQNRQMQGNMTYPPKRQSDLDSEIIIRVGTDTVSAA